MPTRHQEAGGAGLGVAVAPEGLGGGKILPVPAGSQSICDCRNPRQREHVRAPVQALVSSSAPTHSYLYQRERQKAPWNPQIHSSAQNRVTTGCPTSLAEHTCPQGWPRCSAVLFH